MKRLNVLLTFITKPKQIITLGYQSLARKNAEINYEKNIADKYNKTQLPTIDLLDLVPGFHDTIDRYSFLTDTSLITDILLLKSLAKKFDNCAYLEIGSFRGESIACIADVSTDCTSITLSEQEMRDFGMHEGYIESHAVFSHDKKNIKTYLNNSQTFDFSKLNKKFDLIFVDGDHSYNGVLQDTKNVFDLLKDDRSMIVWHDYGFDPENVRHEVLAAILDGTPKQYHNNLYHVSNTMCAVFMKGNFKTHITKRLAVPTHVFKVEVTASKL